MGSVGLTELPNCVLLLLMSYLDATSLYYLSRVSCHFDALAKKHKTLWKWIDARRAPNTQGKVDYCCDRIHEEFTRTVLFRGDGQNELLGSKFYNKINQDCFRNLTILAIEHQTINASRYSIKTFPSWLVELSMRGSVVENSVDFFRNSDSHMTELSVLILDHCDWFPTSALMALSKYPKLEILSLYKSKSVDNSIPYLSISGRFGFKQLRILDTRLSGLGNTLIHCFSRSASLLAIYLQNEDITYKLDYYKRLLAIAMDAPVRNFNSHPDEFPVDDPLVINEANGLNYEDSSALDDEGLMGYFKAHSDLLTVAEPKSYLYVDPYQEKCRCGRAQPPNKAPFIDTDDPDDLNDGDSSKRQKLLLKIEVLNRVIQKTGHGGSFNRSLHERRKAPTASFISTIGQRDANGDARVIILHDGQNGQEAPGSVRIQLQQPDQNENGDGEEPAQKRRRIEAVFERREEEEDDVGAAGPSRRLPVAAPMARFYRMIYVDEAGNQQIKIPLRRLSLRGYRKITDVALTYLNNLELDLLDLTYTSVTKERIQHYLMHHPNCRVVHEDFCTCPTNLHF